ncbi:hypothetical protein [Achromobacter denitrificans]|uniref:hypothetical protein n=1 Tax=Achromobacter denitrificans TaxID=32002 RepID=UPI00242D67B0|nr:hypothetical protein [Achromobacter denitrificans]MBV2160661.1 hypothetical protein [Achromobacter denitrificans]
MTENNAAQPPLTNDQIEALAKKHIAPRADRLDAIMTNPVPYQQTEQFRRVKALIVDVLSNLRAPVADDLVASLHSMASVAPTSECEILLAAASALASAPVTHYECGRSNGDGTYAAVPVRAPVAGEAPPTDWQNALRIAELPEADEALAVFCNDGTLDNAVGLVQAILDAAPQASAVDGLPAWWERFMNELTLRSEDEVRNDLAGILEICALDAIASAAPQASEAVRIQFPAHLRKMWSGGEVQAWLDEHQGVTPPKVSAKGSLERYRKWQAEREEAFGAGVKAAADLIKKTVEDYDANHGSTDCETGTREYPGEGATWVCEMQELEESIRALSAQPARKPATSSPSPAASHCQAMVPGSQESGNSHTDGGTVYE